MKFTGVHRNRSFLSKSLVLSQTAFRNSIRKTPSPPSLIIKAATDCIHKWAFIKLRARDTLSWATPSASIINFWSCSSTFSHFGYASDTCHWLVPIANTEDRRGSFSFVKSRVTVASLFIIHLFISESILFMIPDPVPSISLASLRLLPLKGACLCNCFFQPSKDVFGRGEQAG